MSKTVKTKSNTKFSAWFKLFSNECEKRGIFVQEDTAHDCYEMGESPETAAAYLDC